MGAKKFSVFVFPPKYLYVYCTYIYVGCRYDQVQSITWRRRIKTQFSGECCGFIFHLSASLVTFQYGVWKKNQISTQTVGTKVRFPIKCTWNSSFIWFNVQFSSVHTPFGFYLLFCVRHLCPLSCDPFYRMLRCIFRGKFQPSTIFFFSFGIPSTLGCKTWFFSPIVAKAWLHLFFFSHFFHRNSELLTWISGCGGNWCDVRVFFRWYFCINLDSNAFLFRGWFRFVWNFYVIFFSIVFRVKRENRFGICCLQIPIVRRVRGNWKPILLFRSYNRSIDDSCLRM